MAESDLFINIVVIDRAFSPTSRLWLREKLRQQELRGMDSQVTFSISYFSN